MRRLILIFIINCLFGNLISQKYSILIESGLTLPFRIAPNLPDLSYIAKEDTKMTYTQGIKFKFCTNKYISMKLGMFYEERGWYANVFAVDPKTGESFTNIRTNYFYAFLSFPIEFQVAFGNAIKLHFGTGFNNSLRIGGGTKVDYGNIIPLGVIHPEKLYPKWDLSYSLNFGPSIKIGNLTRISLEGSYFKSLTPIGKYEPIEQEIFHKGYRILVGLERLL